MSFALTDLDGRILALLPLFISDKTSLRIIKIKCLDTGVTGPVVAANVVGQKNRTNVLRALFKYVDEIAKKEKIDILQVRISNCAPGNLPPNRPGLNPLWHCGLTQPYCSSLNSNVLPEVSRIIDLTKAENDILMEMDEDCRSAIRQAQRNGLGIIDPENELAEYYRLHVETWNQTGLTPHEKEYFISMEKHLKPYKAMKYLFAGREGNIYSSVLLLKYKNAVFYWGNASRRECLKYRPNNYILWEAIRWARSERCGWFELGLYYPYLSKADKLYSVGKYKEQFGKDYLVNFNGQKYYHLRKLMLLKLLRGNN